MAAGARPGNDVMERDRLNAVLSHDVMFLVERGKTYGDSWRKRGGIGAFMMLARKWDRLENVVSQNVAVDGDQISAYDIFGHALRLDNGSVLADLRDLRRYLALVEAHLLKLNPGLGFDDPRIP